MFLSYYYVSDVIQGRKASKLNREDLLQLQKIKWLKLVNYVYKHSPFYRKIILDIGKPLEELVTSDFPVLTKKIVLENFDQLVTDPKIKLDDLQKHVENFNSDHLYLGKYHILKTSGSTGKPGYFIATSREVISGVSTAVARGDVGVRRRKKRISMLGFPKSYVGSTQTMGFCNKIWLARQLVDYKLISIEQPFEKVVEELNAFQPHVVSGYAKLLLLLADAQRAGKLKIAPDSVESGGELLLEADRRYLKNVFNCSVNNHYGSTEFYSMGVCRDGEQSIELFEDKLIFDIEGENTFLTNLFNFTMPLIRYQFRDLLLPLPINTAKPFRHVETAIGRTDEIPYYTTQNQGKVTVHPLEIDPIMPEGVKSFSMSCPEPNHIVYHLFIDENYVLQKENILQKTLHQLREFFKAKSQHELQVDVVEETDYQVNFANGKTQIWRNSVL